jgi:virginiamycin B lyase
MVPENSGAVVGLGKITPAGIITEYHLTASGVWGLAAAPDGNVWFTEYSAGHVGKITATGTITEYPVSSSCCPQPYGITTRADGNLWFGEVLGNGFTRIAKMSLTGTVTEFPLSQADVTPMILGPDGNIWFGSINKIGPDGTVTQYSGHSAFDMVQGPDGNIWFTTGGGIGRITVNGSVTTYPLPDANSLPVGIAIGPDGNVWFTEEQSNKIAKLVLPGGAVKKKGGQLTSQD